MGLTKLLDDIKDYRSSRKILLDKYLDPALFLAAMDGVYIYGTDRILDAVSQNIDSHEGYFITGTYIGLMLASIPISKHLVFPIMRGIKNLHKKRLKRGKRATSLSWARTFSQVGLAAYLALTPEFKTAVNNTKYDLERVVNVLDRSNREDKYSNRVEITNTPSGLERLIPRGINSERLERIPKDSLKGRFLRTYRWKNIIRKAEKKYGIERGLLFGLIMRESYGNPLELNSSNDGGAGLMMFQPGTARAYGLKVYGSSSETGSDRNHGLKLRDLVRSKDYNYELLSKLDERFDVRKSINAAAKYLAHLYNRYGSWDKALSAYNRGKSASNPEETYHVAAVRKYQRRYLKRIGESIPYSRSNRHFVHVGKNSKGEDVFRYIVTRGDNPSTIANKFNRWDRTRGDMYHIVRHSNVVRENGNFVGNKIIPRQKVYVVSDKKNRDLALRRINKWGS